VKQPEKLNFEIKALAEGDFIEGLNVVLIPVSNSDTDKSVNGGKQLP